MLFTVRQPCCKSTKLLIGSCFIANKFNNQCGQEDKMRNNFIMIGMITAAFLFGCSTAQKAFTGKEPAKNEAVSGSDAVPAISENSSKLVFTYKVRENLDVQVTFENETAYDAVQLGLSLLNKCQDKKYIPGVEEAAFFPEFFAMVNIETRDGLLFISEKEAVGFASLMFTEYQKKVLPPEQVKKLSKRPVVDQYIVPGSEPL